MPGESAEYSVHRANNTGSGSRRAVLLYPPRSLIHIEMPLIPALRPAVSTVGRPLVAEKLASLSPPQKNGSICDPVVPLRWNNTQSLPFFAARISATARL